MDFECVWSGSEVHQELGATAALYMLCCKPTRSVGVLNYYRAKPVLVPVQ